MSSLVLISRLAERLLGPPLKRSDSGRQLELGCLTPWFGRAIARPSIEGLTASSAAWDRVDGWPGLAERLLGPPLKLERQHVLNARLGRPAFGRAIARPSIEALEPPAHRRPPVEFGRAIARPSIAAGMARAHISRSTTRLAERLLGPPLKRRSVERRAE